MPTAGSLRLPRRTQRPSAWNATIAADGHGVWADATHPAGPVRVPFFVEVDRGTEDLPRLVAKLDAYRRWRTITGRTWPVLFWLTSSVRERHLHERLACNATGIPVATAVVASAADQPVHHARVPDPVLSCGRRIGDAGPAGRVWWPCGHIDEATPTTEACLRTLADLRSMLLPGDPERRWPVDPLPLGS